MGRKIKELNSLSLNSSNITGYAAALKGLSLKQAELLLSTQGLTSIQKQAILTELQFIGTTGKLTTAQMTEILATKEKSKADAKALLLNAGLITSETAEATATNVVTAAKLKEAIQTKALTQEEAQLIAAKAGVTLANQKESVSFLGNLRSKMQDAGVALKGFGTGLLAIASAHPVITGITAALSVCGIAALAHKVKQEKAAKAIQEAYEKAKAAIDEINNAYSTNAAKTKEIAKEYGELAQGVDLLTNKNKSLSSEKYERFLELNSQLSALHPSLVKNFGENGTAILNLSGNIDAIVRSLDDLIQRERILSNQEIMKKMPELFSGYSTNVANFEKQLLDAEKRKKNIEYAYKEIEKYGKYDAFHTNGIAKDINKKRVPLRAQDYMNLFQALDIPVKQVTVPGLSPDKTYQKLQLKDGSDLPNISGIYEYYITALNKELDNINYIEQQLKEEQSSINQYLNTWLQTEFSYNQLENTGLQKAVQETLFHFDWSSLPESIDKNDWDAVSNYFRRHILFSIRNIRDSDVSKALADIYSDSLASGELLDNIAAVQEYFGEAHPISLSLKPKLEDTQSFIHAAEEKFNGNFNGQFEGLSLQELQIAVEHIEVDSDTLLSWDELLTKIKEVQDSVFNQNNLISFSDALEKTDSIQSSLSTLRSALDSFNLGSMTEESVLDLMQQFPELAPYIDLTAQGFGRLSEGLNMLIAQQPASLLESLQTLKASLHTEEERAEVDLLIDSLQRLSSYGDSGMEAYAAAIGTTWNDTANVIGSVTSQFENLAKVQDAVSGGLTMSAAAAAELAKMYPEILTNAVVAANGQVTLNEDVVRNILQGDQSILNAQIAKLEGDKAVLTAKKSFAEAQLNMLKQVGEGEGQIAMETAQYRLNTANQLLKALIDIGMEEAKAYAAVAANMAGNMDEYNRIVGEVAIDSSSNMNLSALSMATTIDVNSSHAQDSITALQKKAHEGAKSIKAMGKGETGGSLEKFQGGGASSLKKIEITKHPGKFHPTSVDIDFKEIDLDEFQSQLELDIQGYTDAISHIDSQIEILKGLQSTFQNTVSSPNGGIGGHNYGDKIKELEKEKEKINSSLNDAASKGSSSPQEKKEEYKELFDFFERRVKVLNTALSLLKTNLDNVTGSFGKNQLLDAQLSITEETFQNYSDALSMYTEKANEALSKIPGDIAKKVKDGAVDLTTFVGDGNKEVMDAIQEYEKWADKINNCKEELAKLKTAIRQLELEKFNNIMEDFSNQFDLREDGKGLISKQMDLLKEAGQFIGESFFTSQMEQSKKQLSLLEEKKTKLASQLASSLSSGRVEAGTDEWLAMVQSLSDVEGEILDCKKAIEAFDNELLQLHWDIFDQVQKQFSQLDSELSNLEGLFDGFKVTGVHGGWSKEGLAQIGLLAQQYELAQYQVEQYNNAIDKLHGDYLVGKYSATEYADKLATLSSAQWEAVNRSESILDAIVNLNEVRINEEINAIKKEVDAYKELINAQIESLKTAKELHDYKETIAEKTKNITNLERQIAAMENDDTAATIAKRKLLEEQLAQARKELENTQYNHSIQMQEEALNKELENYEGEKNAEIEALRLSLEERELLIAQSFEIIKMNADLVGQEIALIAMNHGIIVSDAIITPWQSGEGAIASYGEVLSSGASAFIGQLFGVANEIYALQNQANQTADSLAFMFSQRADNLVHELTASYYSEANLNAMTKALHDSLVNTLEGGYNISGITNALGGIASAANHVALAANNAASALANMGAARTAAASGYSSPGLGSIGSFTPIPTPTRRQGDRVIEVMQQEEDGKWRKYAYASGTRNAKGGLRVVNERGKELVLPKLSSGNYAIGNAGDQILTKPQTDNLFAWSAFQPEDFLDLFASMPIDTIPLTQEIGNIPEVLSHVASPPSIHLDKMVHIDHVDSTNLKQVEMLIYKAQDKFIHQLYDGMKYRQL